MIWNLEPASKIWDSSLQKRFSSRCVSERLMPIVCNWNPWNNTKFKVFEGRHNSSCFICSWLKKRFSMILLFNYYNL